ncbi:SpoIIE family protein phosphatase [Streptomyces sp. NPDC047968]|uniref:ATP-binding SpoIIE family protein phosphatase n=1 Tax=unclassified Streptomyces TaxID=2593676 RepID=UPI0034456521
MRTEDVLVAVATGVWRWEASKGSVSLDAEAARLLGLPEGTGEFPEAAVRSCFHPVDWSELNGIASLALAEGTVAEARLRVVDGSGRVRRLLRTRGRPITHGDTLRLVGTLQEVTDQPSSAAQAPVTGDWRRSREAFLLDAGRALAEARSTAEVLRVAGSLSMPGFSPDGLAVFGAAADRLTIIGHHGHGTGDDEPFTDMPLDTDYPAAEVVRTGRAIYLPSPDDYRDRFPVTWPLAQRFGRESWAFLPLVVAGRTIGAWMAAFRHPVAFTPDERAVLTTVARMLAGALSRAGAAESERELSLGLQRAMMPNLGAGVPGLAVAARYVPTGGGLQIGGDWYDMIPLPGGSARGDGRDGRIALVIGDVQGHDVRAAGLMGQLRIALRAYAAEGHRPDAVLSRASRFLHGVTEATDDGDLLGGPRFATCLYLEFDPATGVAELARAGHPEPVVVTSDGTVLQRSTEGGLPLGVDPDSDYPTTRLTLDPGATLLLCTDGLLETGGHDLDTGWARLRDVLEGHRGAALEDLADALVQAVHGPTSHHTTGPLADRREDDIAVVLMRRESSGDRRPARRTAMVVAQAEPQRIAHARRQVRELLHDWADSEQVDSAVLMVSEMLTNVLVHTDVTALLAAEVVHEEAVRRVRVEVTDGSDELPHRRSPGELASSGRGLVLMEMLSDAWGVEPRGEGKSIWFELYEPPAGEGGSGPGAVAVPVAAPPP